MPGGTPPAIAYKTRKENEDRAKAFAAARAAQSAAKPKPKLKGSASDDSGKHKKQHKKPSKPPVVERLTGRRLQNPLGFLPSYTYQISLYMITPDAYQIFKDSGCKDINTVTVGNLNNPDTNGNINAGAYLVAQSGGRPIEQQAEMFPFDYGIDNLTMTLESMQETGASTGQTRIKFQVTEPYGFSFITNLRRAADAISSYTKNLNAEIKKARPKDKTRAKKKTTKAAAAKANGQPAAAPHQQQHPPGSYQTRAGWKEPDTYQTRGGKQTSSIFFHDAPRNSSGTQAAAPKTAAKKSPAKSKNTQSSSQKAPYNFARNFYVLGVRFFGWDEYGSPVRGSDMYNGTPIDPNSSGYALFERYFPITFTNVKTKLNGKVVVYNIDAQLTQEQMGQSKKVGMIKNPIKISGGTVSEALDKLMEYLENESKKSTTNGGSSYGYAVNFVDDESAARIGDASIVSKADLNKYKWKGSGAKNSAESNDAKALKSQKPTATKKEFTIAKGTPVMMAINQIITQSAFLEDSLEALYTTKLEANNDKDGFDQIVQQGGLNLAWYHVTPDIDNPMWCDKTKDWVYDIVYNIQIYDVPDIEVPGANPGKTYYGPLKTYDYWYTGNNTAILSYEQEINTLYATAVVQDKVNDKEDGGDTQKITDDDYPHAPGTRQDQPSQGREGLGMEIQNSVQTQIFDAKMATAKIKILGDPDFLATAASPTAAPIPHSSEDPKTSEKVIFDKFYGKDGYTMNTTSGDCFIEINFKEAIDYDDYQGILDLNDSIQFWKSPPKDKDVIGRVAEGISYKIVNIDSMFARGTFSQVLNLNISKFNDPQTKDKKRPPKKKKKKTATRSNKKPANTGLKQDPAPKLSTVPGNTIAHQNAEKDRAAGRLGYEPVRGG